MAIDWVVECHELVQILPLQRIGLQSEVLVGAQFVDPEFLSPRGLGGGLLIEENHVCLYALRVEQARG